MRKWEQKVTNRDIKTLLQKGDLDAAWQAAAALANSSRRSDPVHDLLFSIEEQQQAKLRKLLKQEPALASVAPQSGAEVSTSGSLELKSTYRAADPSKLATVRTPKHIGRLSI